MDGHSNPHAIRTMQEVAEIMTSRGYPMTRRAVWFAERRVFRKLRNEEAVRRLFEELVDEIDDGPVPE